MVTTKKNKTLLPQLTLLCLISTFVMFGGSQAAVMSSDVVSQSFDSGSGIIEFDAAGYADLTTPIASLTPGVPVQKTFAIQNSNSFKWNTAAVTITGAGQSSLTTTTGINALKVGMSECSIPYVISPGNGPFSPGSSSFVTFATDLYAASTNPLPSGIVGINVFWVGTNTRSVSAYNADGSFRNTISASPTGALFSNLTANAAYYFSLGDTPAQSQANPTRIGPITASTTTPSGLYGPMTLGSPLSIAANAFGNNPIYANPVSRGIMFTWLPVPTPIFTPPSRFITVTDAFGGAPIGVTGPTTRAVPTARGSYVFTGLTDGVGYAFKFGNTSSLAVSNPTRNGTFIPNPTSQNSFICLGTQRTVVAVTDVASLASPTGTSTNLVSSTLNTPSYFRLSTSVDAASNDSGGFSDQVTVSFTASQV